MPQQNFTDRHTDINKNEKTGIQADMQFEHIKQHEATAPSLVTFFKAYTFQLFVFVRRSPRFLCIRGENLKYVTD